MPADPFLTTDNVAARLGCSVEHVRRLIRRGELRSVLIGRRHRIPQGELRRYVDAQLAHPQSARVGMTPTEHAEAVADALPPLTDAQRSVLAALLAPVLDPQSADGDRHAA